MPVGTLGAVKGLSQDVLEAAGARILMTNLYHLLERVGAERIIGLGGLHEFIGWDGPLAMDSGGYQVFSLAGLRRIDDLGVTFRSPHDGSTVELTPERVVEFQQQVGVDAAMVLDECPPWPVERAAAAEALRRTNLWARRSLDRWGAAGGSGAAGLFGIVQGSFFEDLRLAAAEDLADLPFDGYAIGGVSVGEERELGRLALSWVAPALPEGRPRYLMGLGHPPRRGPRRRSLRLCAAFAQRPPRHAVLVHGHRPDQEGALPRGSASRGSCLRLPGLPPAQPGLPAPSFPLRRDHRQGACDRAQRELLPRLPGRAAAGDRRRRAGRLRRGRGNGSQRGGATGGRTAIGYAFAVRAATGRPAAEQARCWEHQR